MDSANNPRKIVDGTTGVPMKIWLLELTNKRGTCVVYGAFSSEAKMNAAIDEYNTEVPVEDRGQFSVCVTHVDQADVNYPNLWKQ